MKIPKLLHRWMRGLGVAVPATVFMVLVATHAQAQDKKPKRCSN